ncbi:MAG: winged-helix domain-containing protein [Bacilli bacterium]
MNNKYASKNTLKRLPFYIEYLKMIQKEGEKFVSSTTIAKKLNLNDVQVRKDLAIVSRSGGKPKVGYEIDELLNDFELFLGVDQNNRFCSCWSRFIRKSFIKL